MSNTDEVSSDCLPDTGVGIEVERYMALLYGTCRTTIILIDANDHMDYYEWSYKPGFVKENDIHFDFDIETKLMLHGKLIFI